MFALPRSQVDCESLTVAAPQLKRLQRLELALLSHLHGEPSLAPGGLIHNSIASLPALKSLSLGSPYCSFVDDRCWASHSCLYQARGVCAQSVGWFSSSHDCISGCRGVFRSIARTYAPLTVMR